MIADLHCHYPMHLLPEEHEPRGLSHGFFVQLEDRFDRAAEDVAGRLLNNPSWGSGWRVDLDGLERGGAGLVCSVLYWPSDEFTLDPAPRLGSFDDLRGQLEYVEADLQQLDPADMRYVIARRAGDLDVQDRVVFVHCVEGGFHLGPDEDAIDANVGWLAERGVLYITLAHLFFRGVATNAPAIPALTDGEYNDLFHQPDTGLTSLGRAAVRAMYRHKVLVDISHMDQRAIDETFALIEQLDAQSGEDPVSYPVIATHVGMREANSDAQAYNLDAGTAERVQARGGLIGVIMAQHQIGATSSDAESRELLRRHIDAIAAAGARGRRAVAIGSDLDGFIKPTLAGLERASDLAVLEGWIREDFPEDADAILYGNARRLVRRVFETRARLSTEDSVPVGPDGFCHPASEEELAVLVKRARDEGRELRVRGAAHSVSHAVYTDPIAGFPNRVDWQTPPGGGNLDVMLDRYRGWRVRDESRKLVEADAGIHLGADPSDPTGTATLETSLLWRLFKDKGWTLSSLGGITHQTVSGFIGSGSSGGSLRYSVYDDVWGFRVIDGTGQVHEFTREDPDQDAFYAMAPSLGLLGAVSTITFQCEDTFNIDGQEAITTVEECAVDVFGPGTEQRPSLEQFLRNTEYARVEWWPQRGAERLLVWQARRIAPQPDFEPFPYHEFADHPDLSEILISILFSVFGNLADLSKARPQIKRSFARVETLLELTPLLRRLGWLGRALAEFVSHGAQFGVDAALALLKPTAHLIEREIPAIFPRLLGIAVPLDADKKGDQKNEPQRFHDYGWHGLPMDNEADDELLPTEFTEIWVPLPRTQDAVQLLRSYFASPSDPHESYRRTGLYAWELYSAKANRFWMSPSYTSGDDAWKDGAFRIDVYWFAANPSDPAQTFFPQFWQLLRDNGIPFRLHWGKFQPHYDQDDRTWVDFFKTQYPRWEDFLRLRAARDPNNIFLTRYWRDRLGLWTEPQPSQPSRATNTVIVSPTTPEPNEGPGPTATGG